MTRFWEQSDFSNWPPGISNGLASPCQQCGTYTRFDYQVDDEFWRDMIPVEMRSGVVCLPCLDFIARAVGVDVCQHLREVQYTGSRNTAVLVPALVVETERMS